mmetsp:Transcript_46249/g.93345  ORF Transcript_46249/g.93345 Transcript_46249/m.93345 type:complete len:556 (+) Transcript_46249:80-1747(+)|eukprot:CAMPEP_0171726802 /NCGR_PEP_ID=MMETSP0991-20121206/25897_1 /TAXON_ID=483369 /ORGANISM="non described non described, Strain CCMP2098" /LENGTH=555 /DNA_ID=CAMNT_0012320383 /DNA_START=61 /DNA_END=1728 /DNA_ORIENTATION=+
MEAQVSERDDESSLLLHNKYEEPTPRSLYRYSVHALIGTLFVAAWSGAVFGVSKSPQFNKVASEFDAEDMAKKADTDKLKADKKFKQDEAAAPASRLMTKKGSGFDKTTHGFQQVGKASDWQMYKVTLSVIPGSGSDVSDFFTEYVAPAVADLPTELGCSSKRYAVTLLNQDLHWVDAKELERDGHATTYWNEYFDSVNGDMDYFNPFMHNKVMMYVPSLAAHEKKLKVGKQDRKLMRRLSTDSDGATVAHVSMNVQGRLYELVGPAADLDTSGFSYWKEDTECAAVQGVPESLKSMRDKYDEIKTYHDSSSTDDEVANFALPVPMLVHHSIATDDFSKQNDLAHLVKFTGASVSDTVQHSDTCSSLTLSWDYESVGSQVFKLPSVTYVINTGATETEHSVSDYLDYLWGEHEKFAADYKMHWGDNWDHWLDFHIGMQVTNYSVTTAGGTGGEVWGYHDLIYHTLHEESWPVGYRHGQQTGEGGNDYHFYTGYRDTYAWEYLINEGEAKDHVYDLCGCLPENNAKIYYDEVGQAKEESECGWAEGQSGVSSGPSE